MPTIKKNGGEAGSVGANVSVGTSGDADNDAFSSVTVNSSNFQYANDQTAHGSQSLKIISASNTAWAEYNGLATTQIVTRMYFRLSSLPGTSVRLLDIRDSGGIGVGRVIITAANALQFQTGSGNLKTFAALSTSTWYRLEVAVTNGTSGATLKCDYYVGDSATPVEAGYSTTSGNTTTTNNITTVRFGSSSGNSFTGNIWMDDVALTTDTLTYMGLPDTNVSPVANAGSDQVNIAADSTVTLDGSSSSDADGSIVSYAWTQISGSPTISINDANTSIATFTAPTVMVNTIFTFQLLVTDDGGATGTDTISITVLGSGSVTYIGEATDNTSGTSLTVSYTSTAGNTLVACIQHQGGAIASVTDTAGNTWTAGPDTQVSESSTAQRRVQIWYCINATSVVSVTVNGAAVLGMNLTEFANVVSLRSSATSSSSATSPPAAAPAGVLTGDLVVGCIGYVEASPGTRLDTLNSGTGYTELSGAGNPSGTTRLSAAYSIRDVDGDSGPTWTMTSGTTGSATIAFGSGTNAAPIAYAGSDKTAIEPYSTVTHVGSGNDVDGSIVSYAWAQTSGSPTVSINSPSSPTMTYRAPGTITGTTLIFTLTVVDNAGASGSDDVSDTIYAATERAVIGGAEVPGQLSSVRSG